MDDLIIDKLTKAFPSSSGGDQIVAVDDLSITIEEGEFLVMLGPSGCGKSTTLRCVAGLESPTTGEIRLGDRNITNASPQDRNMAMVFQDFGLYPHMTAEENMGFGLKMTTDLSGSEITDRVEEAADIMDIEDLLDNKPGQLSGGQKQRVALGRAIVRSPDAFLMDEPLSNLDAKLRTQMRTEIQRLHRELAVTTLYVTHDQTEAMTMSDRVAILNDGSLQQIGTPSNVYHHPENQFVGSFIGSPSMNFLEVNAQRRNDDIRLVANSTSSFEYPLSESIVERCTIMAGDTFTLGVRPEDIHLMDELDESPTSRGRVQSGTVDVVEPMGSDNYLYLDVDNSSWIARVGSSVEPSVGNSIEYTFDDGALHLFAPNGRTLKSTGIDDDAYHDDERSGAVSGNDSSEATNSTADGEVSTSD